MVRKSISDTEFSALYDEYIIAQQMSDKDIPNRKCWEHERDNLAKILIRGASRENNPL